MPTWRLIGERISVLELCANVIGIEDGDLRGLLQSFGSVCQDVAKRAQVHAEVAVVRLDLSNRLRTLVFEEIRAFSGLCNDRIRQKRFQHFLHSDRTRAWPTAPVRRR